MFDTSISLHTALLCCQEVARSSRLAFTHACARRAFVRPTRVLSPPGFCTRTPSIEGENECTRLPRPLGICTPLSALLAPVTCCAAVDSVTALPVRLTRKQPRTIQLPRKHVATTLGVRPGPNFTPCQGVTEGCVSHAINHTCHTGFGNCKFVHSGITNVPRGGG